MKLNVLQLRSPLLFALKAVTISLLLVASAAKAACNTPEYYCEVYGYFFGTLCEVSSACEGKECAGKNEGAEITLVPGGVYPGIWIARTEGLLTPVGIGCLIDHKRQILLIGLPETHCAAKLTAENVYLELFASAPDSECYGWVECVCDQF